MPPKAAPKLTVSILATAPKLAAFRKHVAQGRVVAPLRFVKLVKLIVDLGDGLIAVNCWQPDSCPALPPAGSSRSSPPAW